MKKPIIFFSFLAALILMQTSSVLSQEGFRVKFFDNTRDDGGMAYNFFVGDDADDVADAHHRQNLLDKHHKEDGGH